METWEIQQQTMYWNSTELRRQIADMVGDDASRYSHRKRKFNKEAVEKIIRTLDPEIADEKIEGMRLEDMYRFVCEMVGDRYQPTAGRQWGLKKRNLRNIYVALVEKREQEGLHVE